jgi:hypothetical protein
MNFASDTLRAARLRSMTNMMFKTCFMRCYGFTLMMFDQKNRPQATAAFPHVWNFLLKSERLVVETKMTRGNLGQKQIVKQLIEDKAHYQTHPEYDALVAFVYDPASHCQNPLALENDLSESKDGFSVQVVVAPRAV